MSQRGNVISANGGKLISCFVKINTEFCLIDTWLEQILLDDVASSIDFQKHSCYFLKVGFHCSEELHFFLDKQVRLENPEYAQR